jgi:hypothetical protein
LAHDKRFAIQYNQTLVELVRAFRASDPYDDVATSWKKLEASLDRKSAGPKKFLYLLSLVSIPRTSRAFEAVAKTETERRLAIAAIAIERYKTRLGHPPATLDLLVPNFIGAVPRDCMSGRPLCYHLNPNGGFTLYSTGKDGVDNGGDPSPLLAGANDAFWDRRDAGWPTAVPDTRSAVAARLQPNAHPAD